MNAPPCRHCQKNTATHGRGLCLRCSTTPGVRELYPAGNTRAGRAERAAMKAVRGAERGLGLGNRKRKLGKPTTALPGTPAKVRVLQLRARAGNVLFHPQDARL
jgi:hypothetical protein